MKVDEIEIECRKTDVAGLVATDGFSFATVGASSELPQPVEQVPSLCDLLDAAALACSHWKDSPEAVKAMTADCIVAPPHQRADLIQYFKETYR